MNDRQIVDLYWERNEKALKETALKYGSLCYSVAFNILGDRSDSEECVNDTYLHAWNSIPPHRPSVLTTFLAKITRRISIDRWRKLHAEKRGSGQIAVVLDELSECIPDKNNVESTAESRLLSQVIGDFVKELPEQEQKVFICRYWYAEPIETIAARFEFSESKVKSMLHRIRHKLRDRLIREGLK